MCGYNPHIFVALDFDSQDVMHENELCEEKDLHLWRAEPIGCLIVSLNPLHKKDLLEDLKQKFHEESEMRVLLEKFPTVLFDFVIQLLRDHVVQYSVNASFLVLNCFSGQRYTSIV